MKLINNTDIHKTSLCSPSRLVAFGEIELEENDKSQVSTFDIDCLIDALQAVKTLGIEYVDVRIQTNFPMFITGDSDIKHVKTKGLLLSPSVDDEK